MSMTIDGVNLSMRGMRRHIREVVGEATLADLHRSEPWRDLLAILLLLGLFFGFAGVLGSRRVDAVWVACFLAQGQLLMVFGLAAHDFLHRGVGGPRLRGVVPMLFMAPLLRSATEYQIWHARHHTHLGGADDSEQFKVGIDTVWRRLVYATFYGTAVPHRAFPRRPGAAVASRVDLQPFWPQIVREKIAIRLFMIAVVLLAIWQPRLVLLGYVLPLVLVTPISNSIRTATEHTEFDSGTPYQISCCYRSNAIARIAFFWGVGDCHIIHHIFPRIPFYRTTAALRLMRPVFLAHGVNDRASLAAVVSEWFSGKRLYLSANPRPGLHRTPIR